MTRKTDFTRDRHFRFGRLLIETEGEILAALNEIYASYSVNGREAKAAERVRASIQHLRLVMDAAICREAPLVDYDALRAYCPINEKDTTR